MIATASMAVLMYLAHCPTGIGSDAAGTKRYERHEPSEEFPWGFSFDDLFRGVVSYHACARQRVSSDNTNRKKGGGLDSHKMPVNGDKEIMQFVRAGKAQYGRFGNDVQDDVPENMAAQSVVTLADKFRELGLKLGDDASQVKVNDAYAHLWRRTGFLAMAAKYNRLNRGTTHTQRGRREDVIDAMAKRPPIDCTTITALVEEIYKRGLITRPVVTTTANETIFEDFRTLLKDEYSIEQYIASLDRDAAVIAEDLEAETTTGITRGDVKDRLRECHAVLGLLPHRLPLSVDFMGAVRYLGMLDENSRKDDRFNLRVDTRVDKDGKPLIPDGVSLMAFQAIGKLSWLAPIGANYALIYLFLY